MDHQYDVFEVLPDGSPLWREAVIGQESAIVRMNELSEQTKNEVRVIDLRTKTVIAAAKNSQQAST